MNILDMIYTQQRIEGFLCGDYLKGKKLNFFGDIYDLWKKGDITLPEETFFDGIEKWGDAFESLFTGKKMGKVVVRL